MSKQAFIQALEIELAVPPGSLSEAQDLKTLPTWDSMAAVQYIALADEKLGAAVSADEVAKARTVNDLLALVEKHLTA